MSVGSGQYVIGTRLGSPSDEGAVYTAKYRNLLNCAIKYIDPKRIDHTLVEREVILLSLLRHTHLVRITDFGVGFPKPPAGQAIIGETSQYVYVVMEHVPGLPLDKVWKDARPQDLLDLFDQLFDVVAYMHELGVLHMDLKPANILVEPDSRNLVLIDLGLSLVADPHRFGERLKLSKDELALLDSDEVYVASTKEFTRVDRLHYLRQIIKRDELRRHWFPSHDLYALGLIIQLALAATKPDTTTTFVGLELIRDKLLNDQYKTAISARSDLQKLKPHFLAPLGIRELSSVSEFGRHIPLCSLPVYATDRIISVVSHPFFQRLRSIPQLELEYLIYPDARHSRLSHSLVMYELCRQSLMYLLRDPIFRLSVGADDIEGFLLFGLLHDIGHYPLSHMFEDFRGERIPLADVIRTDEDIFPLFFAADPLGDPIAVTISELLAENSTLSSIIEREFSSGAIVAMLSIANCANADVAPHNPIHRVLAGLVSCAVDLDKIAYLKTDSRLTGVPFGLGIDHEAFFSALTVPPSFVSNPTTEGGPIMAVNDKGLAAVESIIMARYWMLSRVYWHHTNRAIMAAYKFVISQLITARAITFCEYLKATFWSTEVEATKYLSDLFDKTFGESAVNPVKGLLNGNRNIYKRLITLAAGDASGLYADLIEREGGATEAILDGLRPYLLPDQRKPGTVIVDVPRKKRDSLEPERLRIVRKKGVEGKATEYGMELSPVVKPLKEEFLNQVKKCRIFLSRQAYAAIEEAGKLEQARAAVFTSLKTRIR